MSEQMKSRERVFQCLSEVRDPEIPVLNVVEMGIVRDVDVTADRVRVVITPTYSGCPAMQVIERRIVAALTERGYTDVSVKVSFAEAWTTEWITDEAKRKLKEYGIAPPLCKASSDGETPTSVLCPFCDSDRTELRAEFGSTACKALYFCNGCQQPFEHFKCL